MARTIEGKSVQLKAMACNSIQTISSKHMKKNQQNYAKAIVTHPNDIYGRNQDTDEKRGSRNENEIPNNSKHDADKLNNGNYFAMFLFYRKIAFGHSTGHIQNTHTHTFHSSSLILQIYTDTIHTHTHLR